MIADVELYSTASVAAAPKSQTILGDGWFVIEPGNQIVLRVASSEMGQGVGTTMAALIAEELEVGAQHTWRGARVETIQAHKRWLALKGLLAPTPGWDLGPNRNNSTAHVSQRLHQGFERNSASATRDGDETHALDALGSYSHHQIKHE